MRSGTSSVCSRRGVQRNGYEVVAMAHVGTGRGRVNRYRALLCNFDLDISQKCHTADAVYQSVY